MPYHNVPAGTYRFQVKAFLLESPEAYDTRTIEITVPPSPLLSPAAVWVYMVLMAVGMLFGLWWYQERLRKQQQGQYTMFEQEQQQ